MSIFWFSKIGTKDSFSRISESLLPLLKNNGYHLHTIIPPNLEFDNSKQLLFDTIIKMGSDINEGGITLKEKEFVTKDDLGIKMKYILLQVLAHCKENNIKTFIITMGVYEADLIMKMINIMKKAIEVPRIILYVPFDYLPNYEAVKNLITADLIITTMPFMVDYLTNLTSISLFKTKWIGHGIDPCFKKIISNRNNYINILNSMDFWIGNKLEADEIIILNANLYGERKRIDITIKAFENLIKKCKHKKLRLWLHGGFSEKLIIPNNVKKLLIVSNKISNSMLNTVYNVCQIGLQTSWGEGWSLTNCEHALIGALQVVPNWLACGFHFKDGRGITYSVIESEHYNEDGHLVRIGIPDQNSVNEALIKAVNELDLYSNTNTIEYMKKYTWENVANEFTRLIE